jgi:hypothetical protein
VEDTKRTRWMGCLTSRRASGTLGHLSLITQTHTSEGGTDRMGHTTQCTHPPTHIRRLFGAQHEWWEGEWAEETVPRRELRQLRLQTWWCGLVLVVWAAKRRCCVCVCVFCERHLENATTHLTQTRLGNTPSCPQFNPVHQRLWPTVNLVCNVRASSASTVGSHLTYGSAPS